MLDQILCRCYFSAFMTDYHYFQTNQSLVAWIFYILRKLCDLCFFPSGFYSFYKAKSISVAHRSMYIEKLNDIAIDFD